MLGAVYMFRKKTKIEKLTLANGRVLIKKTENGNIYEVVMVAKNANYIGIGKDIEVGDLVVCSEYMYSNSFKLDNETYYTITPKQISGFFG